MAILYGFRFPNGVFAGAKNIFDRRFRIFQNSSIRFKARLAPVLELLKKMLALSRMLPPHSFASPK